MADTKFDVIIIGGGPGGYVTAIRAAQLGFKTCVVEKEHMGGICLNWGCIPTKALLRSAEIYHNMLHAKNYGLSAENVSFNMADVVSRSRGVSKRLTGGVEHLMKKNKVTVIDGKAKLNGPGKVDVTGKDGKAAGTFTAEHIIVATGSRPRALQGIEPDKKLIWTYFEAMVPEKTPKSLLVIGSGAIGIEFASFYQTMGVDVTVVEVMKQIMPVEDEEISKMARKQLEKNGLKIMTETKVTGVQKGAD
ncbi:MAG: FAD-dependent oxidoreductase, partial [Rhodospirillales bacterium]